MEKSALGNPLALISEFWQRCFVLSGRLCFLWVFYPLSFLPGHHQQSVLLLCPGVTSHWRGSCRGVTANPHLPACPAGGKQLCGGQEGSRQSSKAGKVGGDIWCILYLGVKFCHPQEGFLGNEKGGVLNPTVEQKTGRHKRPRNIQKPLGDLPKMCASLSINHDLISPSAWSSTGPSIMHSGSAATRQDGGFLLCSLFDKRVMHFLTLQVHSPLPRVGWYYCLPDLCFRLPAWQALNA